MLPDTMFDSAESPVIDLTVDIVRFLLVFGGGENSGLLTDLS